MNYSEFRNPTTTYADLKRIRALYPWLLQGHLDKDTEPYYVRSAGVQCHLNEYRARRTARAMVALVACVVIIQILQHKKAKES